MLKLYNSESVLHTNKPILHNDRCIANNSHLTCNDKQYPFSIVGSLVKPYIVIRINIHAWERLQWACLPQLN